MLTKSNPTIPITTVDDYYVRNKMRWVVNLSDGTTVYEDDNRPGIEEPSAWKRLKAYCGVNHVHIVEMWLQFRSNRVMVEPKNAEGYFLVKSASGFWGQNHTFQGYIAGTVVDGVLSTINWRVPELVPSGQQIREIDLNSPSLIMKQLTTPQ